MPRRRLYSRAAFLTILEATREDVIHPPSSTPFSPPRAMNALCTITTCQPRITMEPSTHLDIPAPLCWLACQDGCLVVTEAGQAYYAVAPHAPPDPILQGHAIRRVFRVFRVFRFLEIMMAELMDGRLLVTDDIHRVEPTGSYREAVITPPGPVRSFATDGITMYVVLVTGHLYRVDAAFGPGTTSADRPALHASFTYVATPAPVDGVCPDYHRLVTWTADGQLMVAEETSGSSSAAYSWRSLQPPLGIEDDMVRSVTRTDNGGGFAALMASGALYAWTIPVHSAFPLFRRFPLPGRVVDLSSGRTHVGEYVITVLESGQAYCLWRAPVHGPRWWSDCQPVPMDAAAGVVYPAAMHSVTLQRVTRRS